MRDPQRITPALQEIERIWRLYPEMRLGQLVSNLADWAEESVWDIEEERLVEEIHQHLKNRAELRGPQRGEQSLARLIDAVGTGCAREGLKHPYRISVRGKHG